MKSLSTFLKGGIHPPGNKHLSEHKEIKEFQSPKTAVIPLSQHLGAPAEINVEIGQEIKIGDLIGKSSGFISANIHSSVSGIVKEITSIFLPHGGKSQAVVIESSEEDIKYDNKNDKWKNSEPAELINKIAEMGIVGLGGATFPANVKFSIPKGYTAEYFVINGVECEPYLTADHRIMLEKTKEIFEGIQIVNEILAPKEIIIGIEANKPNAISIMTEYAIKSQLPVRVVPLKVQYPQGDEKQLLQAVLGKEVPSGKLPIEIGAVVANIGTVYAIYEAICLDKPLFERTVTITGGARKNPSNFKVKIGTKISDLIEACGGFKGVPAKIVVGGPMMGFSIFDLDTPVTKGTSGILALTEKEVKTTERTQCIGCGRCITVCPMGLNPTKLYKVIDHGDTETATDIGLMDCKECGCCAFTCPAHIPLVHGMKTGKFELRRKNAKK